MTGAPRPKKQGSMRLPLLHFVSFVGGFLMILTIALSVFTFTSGAGT